jgi:hypothetical protein
MVGLVVGITLGRMWRPTEQTRNLRYGTLAVWGLSMFVFFYFGFRCPRCRTTLITRGASESPDAGALSLEPARAPALPYAHQ